MTSIKKTDYWEVTCYDGNIRSNSGHNRFKTCEEALEVYADYLSKHPEEEAVVNIAHVIKERVLVFDK